MNSKACLAILLVASVCLIGCTNAWRYKRTRGSSSSSRGYSRGNYSASSNYSGVIAVRRVDEVHPYFVSYNFSRNSSNPLSDLKQGIRAFFNQSGNVTWMVKNDNLLITRDDEVRALSSRDFVEVWFTNSSAPTRSKTVYAFSRAARKPSWSGKDKSGKDKEKGKDKGKDKGKRDRKGKSDEEEEDEFESIDFDSF